MRVLVTGAYGLRWIAFPISMPARRFPPRLWKTTTAFELLNATLTNVFGVSLAIDFLLGN
jgi:hypothetical protein